MATLYILFGGKTLTGPKRDLTTAQIKRGIYIGVNFDMKFLFLLSSTIWSILTMDAQGMPSHLLGVAAGSTPSDASSQVEMNYKISQTNEPSPKKRRRGRPRNNDASTPATNSSTQPQIATRRSGQHAGKSLQTPFQSIRDSAEKASQSTSSQTSDVGDSRNAYNPGYHEQRQRERQQRHEEVSRPAIMLLDSHQQRPSSPSWFVDSSNAGVGTPADATQQISHYSQMGTQNNGTQNNGGTQDEHMQQSLTPTPPPTDATQDLPTSSPINPPNEGNNNGRADDSTLVHDTQPLSPTQRICICDQPSRSDNKLIQCSYICNKTGPCPKQLHKRCLINHGYRPPYDIHPYFCMKYSTKSNPPDTDDTNADVIDWHSVEKV